MPILMFYIIMSQGVVVTMFVVLLRLSSTAVNRIHGSVKGLKVETRQRETKDAVSARAT